MGSVLVTELNWWFLWVFSGGRAKNKIRKILSVNRVLTRKLACLALAVVALVVCMEQWLVVELVCKLVVVERQRIRHDLVSYRRRRRARLSFERSKLRSESATPCCSAASNSRGTGPRFGGGKHEQ